MPIGTQFSTYDFSFDFKTAFLAAPRPIRSSRFLLRQSMHQQYFGPPRPSNNFSRSGQRDASTAAKLNWSVLAFGNVTLHATLNASGLNIAIRFDFNGVRRMGASALHVIPSTGRRKTRLHRLMQTQITAVFNQAIKIRTPNHAAPVLTTKQYMIRPP